MGNQFLEVFILKNPDIVLYLDKNASLFYSEKTDVYSPIQDMPWRLQLPFYFTFLHNHDLAERFKNFELIGAIDIFIKGKYSLGEELNLSNVSSVKTNSN